MTCSSKYLIRNPKCPPRTLLLDPQFLTLLIKIEEAGAQVNKQKLLTKCNGSGNG
jgi:hypothetical protein